MKTMIIRSGGLGDFVLTLPLLEALAARPEPTILVSRSSYHDLIRDDGLCDAFVDIDSSLFSSFFGAPQPRLRELCADAAIYSFLPDTDQAMASAARRHGAASFTLVDPRPETPPHIAARTFAACGLALPSDFPGQPALRPAPPVGADRLWLHPGSGSPAKNASIDYFAALATDWAAARGREIVVSFGEADLALLEGARSRFAHLPCDFLVCPSLVVLRRRLAAQAAKFVGNDSGVTHLAAALGIPTVVVYTVTDPAVWRPVGTVTGVVRHPPCE